jgi:hypothetical protein
MGRTYSRYRPLKDHEIRVLNPPKSAGRSWELVHVNLASKPRYTALSYAWGSPETPCTISIEGNSINIGQNLADALFELTPRLVPGTAFAKQDHIWVDAICINQQDLAERSRQVRMMRQVYEQAHQIFVWLGKPGHPLHARQTFQMIDNLEKVSNKALKMSRPYKPWWKPSGPPRDNVAIFYKMIGPLHQNKEIWDKPGTLPFVAWMGFFEMLESSWWRRTWVYQEATVPESLRHFVIEGVHVFDKVSKVKFAYGSLMTSWAPMITTAQVAMNLLKNSSVINDLQHSRQLPNASWDLPKLQRLLNQLDDLRSLKQFRTERTQLDFLSLLQIWRGTSCQDPRDKVYAPLGLADSMTAARLTPDYTASKTALVTYLDVVRLALGTQGHELDFLGYATKLDRPISTSSAGISWQDWPSWLPNWDEQIELTPLSKTLHIQRKSYGKQIRPYDARNITDDRTKSVIKAYNASSNATPNVRILGLRLAVQGFICDVIVDTIGHIDFDTSASAATFWKSVGEMSSKALTTWRDIGTWNLSEPFAAAFWRTIAADVKYNRRSQVYERDGSFDCELISRTTDSLTDAERERRNYMVLAAQNALHHRSVCRSQGMFGGGQRLGLVPDTARSGDLICALIGGQVLYAIRPAANNDDFLFIGECYVDGLMDGAAYQVAGLRSQHDAQTLYLR